ncbi:MAG: hypothetical protein LKK19_02880 [Bacteroidales bacterium]|jgi:hypothetical protein|nr:hypothetical protein [Bacteroidales bacterium]MCI2121630.1 hypothetical protein [Bacteroidales bacterium]MCI2146274.1 hypothetical protein [Bacteroidales bacterium]
MKRRFLFTISVLLCFTLKAQQYVFIEPPVPAEKSFAIIADSAAFENCREAILSYRDAVQDEGYAVYVAASCWRDPESVKRVLKDLYDNHSLAGAAFVGDIPVAMVRGAQHMTSAFKMDERQPRFDSSVPSDRFYDDFGLVFDYMGTDKDHPGFFYYELDGRSPQYISSDIFTGRIRPYLKGEEGYAQLRAYFKKLVAEKKEENRLDKVVSFTGHGSFSNSLPAWKDESVTLREQIPSAFEKADGARFYIFYMYPYMKYVVADELQRPDLDLMLFHEHGTPDRQWMTGEPFVRGKKGYMESGRRQARQAARQLIRYDMAGSQEEALAKTMETYGIDSSWVAGAFDPAVVAADSIEDLRTGIVLEDVSIISPNSLVTIFDACYNGDFRERDFIADRYIFSGGRSVVCVGNSVNVLQDKSSSDLLGMLSLGYTVGEWLQMTNILESHVIGDPTFRFAPASGVEMPDIRNKDCGYWMDRYRDAGDHYDVKAICLYGLYRTGYPDMSDLLLSDYRTSPSYMYRLQCLNLSAHYADGNYVELLKEASVDPYEFIRRKAAYYMGKAGDGSLLPYLAAMCIEDYMSERELFNIFSSSGHFRDSLFMGAVDSAVGASDYIFDKDEFLGMVRKGCSGACSMAESTFQALHDTTMRPRYRSLMVSNLRNNPYPWMADDVLSLAGDTTENLSIRIQAAEALGWYVYYPGRSRLATGCRKLIGNERSMDADLKDELYKTINRLEAYIK